MFGEYQNVYKSEDQKNGFHFFYFDKILTHANAIDRMHVNARENGLLITFLPTLF